MKYVSSGGTDKDFDAISICSYGIVAIKCVNGVYSFTRRYNSSGIAFEGNFLKARYVTGSQITIETLASCHVRWGSINYSGGADYDQDYAAGVTVKANTSDVCLFYATESE